MKGFRFGPVGRGTAQPIDSDCKDELGYTVALREKCHSCPYRAGSIFQRQLKDIHKATEEGNINICHNTFPSDVPYDAMCRGSLDAFPEKAKMFEPFHLIEEPKSQYIVIPLK